MIASLSSKARLERALIFGAGFLGTRIAARLPGSILSRADISDRAAVRKAIAEARPTAVINCAAKTGRPNIDWCEDHRVETMASNVLGPIAVAAECLDAGVPMAHVGSGCVYGGDKGGTGWTEDDEPNFLGNVYTRSKVLSERALRELPVLQVRMRMPIDGEPGPKNLITKLVQYRRVIPTPNSVSVLDSYIRALLGLLEKGCTGIYNATNPGAITFPRILELYREMVDPAFRFEILSAEQLATVLKAGRTNCVLDTRKLEREGIVLPPIEEALRQAMAEYGRRVKTAVQA